MSILISALGILFAFGLVIFVHELGHFIVAKRSGVRVDRFAFGLGPELVGFQWGETRYCIAWFPLGGEVRMAGEYPGDQKREDGEPSDSPAAPADTSRHFFSQPWYRRIAIAAAGPFMNYVLAVALFAGIFLVWGEQVPTFTTEVGAVEPGKPAQRAGLAVGDTILEVGGVPVASFEAMREVIIQRPEQETPVLIDRQGRHIVLTVVPERRPDGLGQIGIRPAPPQIDHRAVGPVGAVQRGFVASWRISTLTLSYLGQKIITREAPDVAGPIGIGHFIAQKVKAGPEEFLSLVALLSVAIGLFNLFPVPLLDGGHIVYYVIEGIRGKPISANVMGRANAVGLVLLLGLLVFATMNDVRRLRGPTPVPAVTADSNNE